MKLYIDSTNNLKTVVRLDDKEFTNEVKSPRDQDVLGFIKTLLEKQNIPLNNITSIEVNPGPGSFTGSRVGVTIANALGFALGLKVNNSDTPIEVVYSEPPHITIPKK